MSDSDSNFKNMESEVQTSIRPNGNLEDGQLATEETNTTQNETLMETEITALASRARDNFANSETVKKLQKLKDQGKIQTDSENVEKIGKESGMSQKEIFSLIVLLTLDLMINQGRGLSDFFDSFMEGAVNKKILTPVMKKLGVDQETIDSLINKGSTRSKGIFQLQSEVLQTVVDQMSQSQRQDLVNSLTKEEQRKLFADTPRDPYNRLTPRETKELFNEQSLGKDYLVKLRTRLAEVK